MFKVGQQVKLRGRDEVIGQIIEERGNLFKVEYDKSKNWIPRADWHGLHEIVAYDEVELETNFVYSKTCNCGAKHTDFPDFHASYCDLFEEFI